MIQTTIPYDEGWRVYVDGAEVETYKTLDALMAFDIQSSGAHTLELKYSPEIYKFGAIISITGTTCFILLCLFEFVLKLIMKKRGKSFRNEPDVLWVTEDFDEDLKQTMELPPEEKSTKKKIKDVLALFKFKKKSDPVDEPKAPDESSSEETVQQQDDEQQQIPPKGE